MVILLHINPNSPCPFLPLSNLHRRTPTKVKFSLLHDQCLHPCRLSSLYIYNPLLNGALISAISTLPDSPTRTSPAFSSLLKCPSLPPPSQLMPLSISMRK